MLAIWDFLYRLSSRNLTEAQRSRSVFDFSLVFFSRELIFVDVQVAMLLVLLALLSLVLLVSVVGVVSVVAVVSCKSNK